MVRSKQEKTKYNSDGLRQWIHIAEDGARITGRFFDPLKMAESIMDLRTHEYKDSRKLEQNKNVIGK